MNPEEETLDELEESAYVLDMEEILALEEPDELRDADAINRALGAMRWRQRQMDRDKAVAEAQKARIDAWLDRRTATNGSQYDWLEATVTSWHAAILRDNPKRTHISFPNGDLRATKQQDEWVIDDEVFLLYSEGHDGVNRRVKYEVDRKAIKNWEAKRVAVSPMESILVDENGEEIPGVFIVVRPDKKLTAKPSDG